MSAISTHRIYNGGGSQTPILQWVIDHKYRNVGSFDAEKQLEYAKKIAAVDDKDARTFMLQMLSDAAYLQRGLNELHEDFETLFSALTKIDESQKAEAAAAAGKIKA